MKILLMIWFCCLCFLQGSAQLFLGEYRAGVDVFSLNVLSENKARLTFYKGTSFLEVLDCKIVNKTNTSFQLIPYSKKALDTIVLKRKKREKVICPKITFAGFTPYGEVFKKENVSYELKEDSEMRILTFTYTKNLYKYKFSNKYKYVKVYIDLLNSWRIRDWKIEGKEIIPIVRGEVYERWVTLTKTFNKDGN